MADLDHTVRRLNAVEGLVADRLAVELSRIAKNNTSFSCALAAIFALNTVASAYGP